MLKDRRILAPSFFEGVGQYRQVFKPAVVVDASGHQHDGPRPPGWVEGDGAEGVAEDVKYQDNLGNMFGGFGSAC